MKIEKDFRKMLEAARRAWKEAQDNRLHVHDDPRVSFNAGHALGAYNTLREIFGLRYLASFDEVPDHDLPQDQ